MNANFPALHESATGPSRRFAAVQQSGSFSVQTGHQMAGKGGGLGRK